ncbi:MAG: bifunctional diguanylate cyclase/phosphodiesterase [Woeseiaceae bacterium]|nr:bifunctional diguanylate cyclase/phosphodiesterase [Woeseiaceae bacterium]
MSTTSIQLPFLRSDGLAQARRRIEKAVSRRREIAVMIVHLRDVESVCASVGHERCRTVLDDFHARLMAIARNEDAVERIDDRKFAVLLSGMSNRAHVGLAAKRIERLAREASGDHGLEPGFTSNIGIALCPAQGREAAELLRFAEIASIDGRNSGTPAEFFEARSADRMFADWGMERRLDSALNGGDLELYFQPKLCLRTNRIAGAEALLRWQEPEIGPISPAVFVELAEATGQIAELTQFAIQNACRRRSESTAAGPDWNVAVNVTPSTIRTPAIVDWVESATRIWNVRPSCLTLEVTESALMEDQQASHAVLTRLREIGARVAIDDFGTGFSSLAYLKQLPADELKIDRSFVVGMHDDPDDYKIVEHVIGLARSFGLSVVAEGVENADVLQELRALGCDYAQGYCIHRPVPFAAFEEFAVSYATPATD